MTTSAVRPSAVRLRVPARSAVPVIAGAVLTAVLVWFAAVVLGGVDLRVAMGGDRVAIGVGSVVVAAAAAGLLGWGLLAVLARGGRRGVAIWRVVAVVVLLLSLGGPLSSATGAAAAVLVALHAAVAAVLVPLLPRAARS